MSTLDLSSMPPSDAAVALRSFPRRFRDAAGSVAVDLDGEPDPGRLDELAARTGPDGHSALDVVRTITDRLTAAHDALERGLVTDATPIEPRLLRSRADIGHEPGATATIDESVERLAAVCERLATRVEDADPARWDTALPVAGGGTATPLEILQETVAATVLARRDLERTLRAARGRPSP